jgi:disulfide bond formation protein DsbB
MRAERIAIVAGFVALALILGALGFQYLGNLPPCEMCHWQRWPHIGAAITGIVGGALIASGRLNSRLAVPVAALTLLLILASGTIGAYQAGVEWQWWSGPAACTGPRIILTGTLDLNHPVVRCDVAAFRLFGISLAGYNALISFATALAGAVLLARKKGS